MHLRMVTAAIVGVCIAAALLLSGEARVLAKPFTEPGQKSPSDALKELSGLLDRFGETDGNGIWKVVNEAKLAEVRKVAENNDALKNLEDWSYLKTEDCSLWLSDSFSDKWTLYEIPLGKIKTPIKTFSKCDECDGTLYLQTEDNEKAIVTTVFQENPTWISVTDENFVYPALSSLKRANQAAVDLSIAIRSCKDQN
jgi:hypothetical protein